MPCFHAAGQLVQSRHLQCGCNGFVQAASKPAIVAPSGVCVSASVRRLRMQAGTLSRAPSSRLPSRAAPSPGPTRATVAVGAVIPLRALSRHWHRYPRPSNCPIFDSAATTHPLTLWPARDRTGRGSPRIQTGCRTPRLAWRRRLRVEVTRPYIRSRHRPARHLLRRRAHPARRLRPETTRAALHGAMFVPFCLGCGQLHFRLGTAASSCQSGVQWRGPATHAPPWSRHDT